MDYEIINSVTNDYANNSVRWAKLKVNSRPRRCRISSLILPLYLAGGSFSH